MNRRLPCGCTTDGYICPEHRRYRWQDDIAADPAAIVALALFIGCIGVWSVILGGG